MIQGITCKNVFGNYFLGNLIPVAHTFFFGMNLAIISGWSVTSRVPGGPLKLALASRA